MKYEGGQDVRYRFANFFFDLQQIKLVLVFFAATSTNRFATVHIHPFRSRETRLFDAAEKIVEEEKLVEDIAEKTLEQKEARDFTNGISNDRSRIVDKEEEESQQTYVDPDMKLSLLPTSIDMETQVETNPVYESSSSSANLRKRVFDVDTSRPSVLSGDSQIEEGVNLSV